MAKLKSEVLLLFGILLGLLSRFLPAQQYLQRVLFATPPRCENPNYDVRILSYDPLIMHLENFVSEEERNEIINYAEPRLERSHLVSNNGSKSYSTARTSSSALLPRNVSAAQCILDRFTEFQGFVPSSEVENLQITAYREGQQFRPHMDWGTNASNRDSERWRRATTGFVILDADCQKCGTQFPRLRTNWTNASADWCRIADCEEDALTIKPLPGSVLFWQNTKSDGIIDKRLLHAGLPVQGGSKMGLNIWTKIDLRDRPVHAPERAEFHSTS